MSQYRRPPDKGGSEPKASGGLIFLKPNPPLAKTARDPLIRGSAEVNQ
jgi:hypothetical protein